MTKLDDLLTQHVEQHTPERIPEFSEVLANAQPGQPRPGAKPSRSALRRPLAVAAAAGVVVLGGWGAVQLTHSDTPTPLASGRPAPTSQSGALPDYGAASCAFEPTPANLRKRAFAFDGTVARIEPGGDNLGEARVTFTVHTWYVGGSGSAVTVRMRPPGGSVQDSDEAGPSYALGTRLLVSGQPRWGGSDPLKDAIVWGCGFTRYWDASTADEWRQLFAH